MTAHDPVNHPKHYAGHPIFSGECIEYTRYLGFDDGNAFKYLWRFMDKEKPEQDLKKCLWYLADARLPESHNRPIGRCMMTGWLSNRMRSELYAPDRHDEHIQSDPVLLWAEALYSIAHGEDDYWLAENIIRNSIMPILDRGPYPTEVGIWTPDQDH